MAYALDVPILPIFVVCRDRLKNSSIRRKNKPDKQMALNTSAPKPSDA
jgi:hypothetical protein